MKNYVWRKTLQKKAVVTTAQEFVDLAKQKFPEFVILFCSSDDIRAKTMFLKQRYLKYSKPVPKTLSIHHVDVVENKLVSSVKSPSCKCHSRSSNDASAKSVSNEGSSVGENEEIKPGDYVKVVQGNYINMFAIVTDEKVGDEFVIQYFQKKEKWWILKPNDFDARLPQDLKKVEPTYDRRGHAFFKE